jgi:protease-3
MEFKMKKLLILSGLSLALLVGCSTENTTNNAQPATPESLVPDQLVISPNDQRDYRTLQLENSIEVILVSDESVEKSAAALSVSVGLLQDPMTQQGMAHYLEHMLFLGTERFPDPKEYAEFMTQNGGARNAYTWLDITNYMFSINNDAYTEALDRFSDFFKAPQLYPEYTEKEKSAVNAEWSMRRETDFFGQFKLARKMMGEHPANRFLIGNLETLGDKENSNLHAETVAFFEQYYSANIMKVAMISNRPLDEMEALAVQYFGNIENKNIEPPMVDAQLDFSQVGKKKVFYKPNEDVKTLQLDFTIENNNDDFAVKPNSFLAYLLYSEMPGTPAQILRENGWISNLSAGANPAHYGNYGNFYVDISLTDLGMQHRDEIVATVMQYIELIKEQGVDAKYFDEIRTSLNNQFQFLEKGDEFGYVSNLAAAMQNYPLNNAINAPFFYGKFDQDAITNLLAQLKPETLKIWYTSKQEETDSELYFYDGKYRIADLTQAEIDSWKTPSEFALQLPKVNELLPQSFALKVPEAKMQEAPQLVKDNNGIKVWQFASKDFGNQPKGFMEVYVNNSATQSDIDTAILLELWEDLFSLNNAALSTEASIAGMSMRFNAAIGFRFTINGFTDKQAELLSQGMSNLQFAVSEQDFEQAVDRYVRRLANAGKQFPFRQAFSMYQKMIRDGSYETEALIAKAKTLKAEQLEALMQSTLSNNEIRAFVFGNYDSADIDSLVAKIEGALPQQRNITSFTRSKMWMPQAGETLVLQRDIDVADVAVIDIHVHPQMGYAQRAQGLVLQSHFSTVAFDKMRTEEQLAYAVGGFSPNIDEYAGLGLYIQTPEKSTTEMQARFDAFKQEYKLELDKMTPESFEQLKNSALVGLKEPAKNLSEEVSPYLSDWYQEKFDFDSRDKLIAAVENVELADIQSFYAQTMLNPDAARLNIQLRGTKFTGEDFASFDKQITVDDVSTLSEAVKHQ